MSRPCSICASPLSREVAVALTSGSTLKTVAGRFGFSVSALSRHGAHFKNGLELVPTASDPTQRADAGSLINRLLELTEQTRRVQAFAIAAGDARLLLDAVRSEAGQLERLAGRSGVNPEVLARELAASQALLRAIGNFLHRHPRTSDIFAGLVEAEARDDQAPEVRDALLSTARGIRAAAEQFNEGEHDNAR